MTIDVRGLTLGLEGANQLGQFCKSIEKVKQGAEAILAAVREVKELEAARDRLTSERVSLAGDVERLLDQKAKLQAELVNLQTHGRAEVKTSIEAARARAEAEHRARLAELRADAEQVEATCAARIEAARKRAAEAEAEYQAIVAKRDHAQAALDALKEKLS